MTDRDLETIDWLARTRAVDRSVAVAGLVDAAPRLMAEIRRLRPLAAIVLTAPAGTWSGRCVRLDAERVHCSMQSRPDPRRCPACAVEEWADAERVRR